MITSKYLFSAAAENGSALILNLLTNEVLSLPGSLVDKTGAGSLSIRLNKLEESERKLLLQKKVVFETEKSGEEELERTLLKFFSMEKSLGITLVLSYFCNCKCGYCAQKKLVDINSFMSMDTANRFIRWVKDIAKKNGLKHLAVTHFGGEPLLNKRVMFHTSRELKKLAGKMGFDLEESVFTNGTLLDRKTTEELVRLNIRKVTITIDGSQKVHDARRPYKNGLGTYRDVTANLEKIRKAHLDITIAVNLDSQSVRSIEDLLRDLTGRGIAGDVRFVFNRTGKSLDNADFFDRNKELSLRAFSGLWGKVHRLAGKYNLKLVDNPVKLLTFGFCDLWSLNNHIVMPNGELTKCLMNMNQKDKVTGTIASTRVRQLYDLKKIKSDVFRAFSPVCRKCELLPLCFGGCRYQAEIRGLFPRKPFCQKQLILKGLQMSLKRFSR